LLWKTRAGLLLREAFQQLERLGEHALLGSGEVRERFLLLSLLPIDFPFVTFAAILFLTGISMGMFASPNRAAVMNSLPPEDRGAGGGMNQTFQNSAQVLSVGIFFTLMIIGLAANLPHALASGLQAHGVSAHAAHGAAKIPPVSILFAAFLGYNPIEHLIGTHALASLSASNHAVLTGARSSRG
jgi:MFS family permease